MRFGRCVPSALILVLGGFSLVVAGQSGLAPEVIAATSALNFTDQQRVEVHIAQCIDALNAATFQHDIVQARVCLTDPIRDPDRTDYFILEYVKRLADQLHQVVSTPKQRHVIRMNTMIVIAEAAKILDTIGSPIIGDENDKIDKSIIALLEIGLQDDSPAIQYWAAKAAALRKSYDNVKNEEQKRLLLLLAATARGDSSPDVLTQCFIAMNNLAIPEADIFVVKLLNHRANMLKHDLNQPLVGEIEGLRVYYLKLVKKEAAGKALVSVNTKKELSRSAYLLMTVTINALADNVIEIDNQTAHKVMISLADTILNWAVHGHGSRAEIEARVENKHWDILKLECQKWLEDLCGHFGFQPAELEIEDQNWRGSSVQG